MSHEDLKKQLAELFAATGKAHHQAFLETDGEDPEWPIWYAEYLQQPLGSLLDRQFTRSDLVYCVMNAEFERATSAPDAEWSTYYADHFVERYAPAVDPDADKLALYHFPSCPFCARARSEIERLGVDVELRDIQEERKHRDDLAAARGRTTVPVLRITSPDGTERWMPESRDIIRWLRTTYG